MNRFLPALATAAVLSVFAVQTVAADPQEQPSPSQQAGPSEQASPSQRSNLVTIVTTYDPETQMMAMTLTLQAMQKGASARVLLCGPGGDLALKSPPASSIAPQKPSGKSPREMMQTILQAGAPVEVCAIYLPNRSMGSSNLLAGVGQATPDAIAAQLIAPNTRILSF